VTVLDRDYPDNLRAVHDRPALIFIKGKLSPEDDRAVAIIGSRRASPAGRARAAALATRLGRAGCTIVSGLAAGIDTAAHTAALETNTRTIAVIGTGLEISYPPENAPIQRTIADRGAVVSQFWPDAPPTRESFPQRNATMSAMARVTVIAEATQRSGARSQARHALAHGRPVFVHAGLLEQNWARELAARPGVKPYDDPDEVLTSLECRHADDALTA
jgi:DNA processing protein